MKKGPCEKFAIENVPSGLSLADMVTVDTLCINKEMLQCLPWFESINIPLSCPVSGEDC